MSAKEVIYETWAPPSGTWSNWVKPVLFAYMESLPTDTVPLESLDISDWVPPAAERVALVLDLPGDEGVKIALAAAKLGYRPVPLYNAVPFPITAHAEGLLQSAAKQTGTPGTAFVDVVPIMIALSRGTEGLKSLSLANDAPPAFMLDANRRVRREQWPANRFDNRSISLTTDFPSANFLRAKGIHKALLVQNSGRQPQADLAHTLRAWQEGGLSIQIKSFDQPGPPVSCVIDRPSFFGWFWYRVLAAFGLRRNPLGGFGGFLPDPESGGWSVG